MIVFAGHEYESVVDFPDLGSFRCDVVDNGKRNYYGLSTDSGKLPTVADHPEYKDLKTGSIAYCVDNGDLYMYESSGDTWHKQ